MENQQTIDIVDPQTAVQPWMDSSVLMLEQAKKGEVTDDESTSKMTDLVGYCAAQIKKMEVARKALVTPLNDHVKMINAGFKTAKEPFEEASAVGRKKLTVYITEQQRIAREQEAIQRKAEEDRRLEEAAAAEERAAGLREAGDSKAAEEATQEAEQVLESVSLMPERKDKIFRGNTGASASTRKVKTAVVIDIVAAVTKYPELFEFKATTALKMMNAGLQIPGVEIQETDSLVIR